MVEGMETGNGEVEEDEEDEEAEEAKTSGMTFKCILILYVKKQSNTSYSGRGMAQLMTIARTHNFPMCGHTRT